MAEYSGHAEAPQASGRPFKNHKDAAPAYEGEGGKQFFPVSQGVASKLRHCFWCPMNGTKGGICMEFSG